MFQTISIATRSVLNCIKDLPKHELSQVRERLGSMYSVKDGQYSIFRETHKASSQGEIVILVIGFRLKLIRSVRLMHWVFQRVCIITTPFWGGLPGFKTKLWMVDPKTKNYLGIYDWRGKSAASAYIKFLLPILNFFSVHGSVWADQVYGQRLEQYLAPREV